MDDKKIIDSIQLPTLSKTLFEIIEVEKANPISFLNDIKKIVERDPFLSAHILKIANSPLYGFSQKVRTISHAIGLLGIRKIRNIAFSFSIFDFIKKLDYKISYGKTFNLILKKSLLISAISTILAKKINYLNHDELYVSGLITEIGQMVLFLYDTESYCDIYTVNDKKLVEDEQVEYGTDHIQLGIAFCTRYNLPDFFNAAIRFHWDLVNDDEHCKISFIANQIAELLLMEDQAEKAAIFKEIENHTKKLLHLSLTEIEETIKSLPSIIDTFTGDFPEMQKDLTKIIEKGSSLIISLMKKEMDMVILTKELTVSQKKLAEEKMFLSHMLNLSYFFSSRMSPTRIISSLFEYFENFITEFNIEFINKNQKNDTYDLFESKSNGDGKPFDISFYPSLVKSKISNETVRLEKEEIKKMGKPDSQTILAFPISYHHNFFGFFLLKVDRDRYASVDIEMSYVQILSNIIANSFQNYYSFEGLRNETSKKQLVTKELLKFDKQLNHSKENVIELQKSEILGELLPVIFHKLKNKLTPILGYSQILLAKVNDSTINQRIKKIEKNANELASQLNTLREYFKIEKVTEEIDNINKVICRLKPYFKQIQQNKDISITLDMDKTVPDDLINPGQIEAMLTNIIDNAVIAVEEKGSKTGQITISTAIGPEDGQYLLSVKDNGIGIDENEIFRIWAPFHSDFPQRSGIGLTICEKVISNHNAIAEVTSKKGEFTEFQVLFTCKLKDKEETEQLPVVNNNIKGKILIVDDEAYLLDLMKEILLSEGGFEVLTAGNGKEAKGMIDSSLDLIISDIRMPGVSGMDLYYFIKSKHMQDKVLMVTADPFSEDVAAFLKENNIEYLKKPFELMKFKQLVFEKLS